LKIFINASSGVPIYRQIIQQIENGVAGGILNPGEQLPTVREVALKLTINPNTVARAYRELENSGVIESIQGRGTYVSKNVPHLSGKAREKMIKDRLEEILREAHQLNISPAKVEELFREILLEISDQ